MLNLVSKALAVVLTCIIAFGTAVLVSAFGLLGLIFKVITAILGFIEDGVIYIKEWYRCHF